MNRREHKRKPTSFDQDIKILRGGKEIRNYDLIQSGREGTEIFDMSEDEREQLELTINKAYGDQKQIDELAGLRGSFELHEKAIEKWKSLPLSVREKFNNDPKLFAENGAEWLKAECAKIDQQKLEEQKKALEEQAKQKIEGGKNNG